MRDQGVAHLLSSAKGALTPPEPAFPSPAHYQGRRMIRAVCVGGSVVAQHGQAKLRLLIEDIHPVEDDIVLDLVPPLEVSVAIAAAADVVSGVLVDRLI